MKRLRFQGVSKNRERLDSVPSREYKGSAAMNETRRSNQEIAELVYPRGNNR